MKKLVPFIALTLFFAACAPQAELVKTRSDMAGLGSDVKALKSHVADLQKRLELLEANVQGTVDAQKVMADYGARFDQFTTDMQLLQGKLEENNFRLAELNQKLDDKGFKIAELESRLAELEAKIKPLIGEAAAEPGKKPAAEAGLEPSEAYRQSKADYDKGNFELAIAGFRNYLKQFPTASQADNAQYWIGESFYAKKDYDKAIDSFQKMLKDHPRSGKAPAAKLKIGYSYLNEKNTAKAKEYLNRVVREHPASNEADLARDKLKKIGK